VRLRGAEMKTRDKGNLFKPRRTTKVHANTRHDSCGQHIGCQATCVHRAPSRPQRGKSTFPVVKDYQADCLRAPEPSGGLPARPRLTYNTVQGLWRKSGSRPCPGHATRYRYLSTADLVNDNLVDLLTSCSRSAQATRAAWSRSHLEIPCLHVHAQPFGARDCLQVVRSHVRPV
jgi:hypothetical protein